MCNIDLKFIEDFYKKEYKEYSMYIDTYTNLITSYAEKHYLKTVLSYATGHSISDNPRSCDASIIILCLS